MTLGRGSGQLHNQTYSPLSWWEVNRVLPWSCRQKCLPTLKLKQLEVTYWIVQRWHNWSAGGSTNGNYMKNTSQQS